jgi:hypothetical protein
MLWSVQMLPPFPLLSDWVALLGIALALCAACAALASAAGLPRRAAASLCAALFGALWLPVGGTSMATALPLVSYVRAATSDLSVTLVLLSVLALVRHFGTAAGRLSQHSVDERTVLCVAVVLAAAFLYPTALGWGDWDLYRLGWGSLPLLAGLLGVCVVCIFSSHRLLACAIALAVIAWAARLMESTNLWDYLLDPWLVAISALYVVRRAALFSASVSRRLGMD